MTAWKKARAWLRANRSSARMAFLLRIATMALGAIMSLVWPRLLLDLIGTAVMGNWIAFQRALRLSGLGDFGLSGALAVRAGQMIGRGEEEKLRPFLASARTVLLGMAMALGLAFCLFAPWIPRWLDFNAVPGTGSLTMLFVVGGITITLGLVVGYFTSLNAAYATVTWPIVPVFLLGQLAFAGQWLIARGGGPLWAQAIAPVVATAIQGVALWWMVRAAHPWLGELTPLGRDRKLWRELVGASGWIYLYSLGNLIFTATDALLINKGFGPAAVTPYQFNYRLVELAVQVIGSASFIGQSKINLWIHSPDPELRERARAAVQRLCMFQSLLGTFAALGYLAVDSQFIRLWVGAEHQVPMILQWAFAFNLAVTMSGDSGIQVAGLCGANGLRTAGIAIGATALLNLALSYVALRCGSIAGIAWATVLAQSILSIVLARYLCRHLQLPLWRWCLRSFVLPVVFVAAIAAVQWKVGSTTWSGAGVLLVVAAVLAVLHAWLGGVNRDFIRHELAILRSFLPRQTS